MTQFSPLRNKLDNWTLEDDNNCFVMIQNFTESFMNKANEIQNSFKDTEYNLNTFKAIINNNFSKLSNLQNEKFTENKMAPYNEDDLFIKSKENELNEANAENEVPLTQKYQEALNLGMKSLDLDQIQDQNLDANDDTLSLTNGANDDKLSHFSQFSCIPSKHTKFPCIIGTSNFYNDPYLGIIEIDDQIIAKSQIQDQNQQIAKSGFEPTQNIIPNSQMQQSLVVNSNPPPQQPTQQPPPQVTTNPAAPQAPSLDLLAQGAAAKKSEPQLPQIQPPLPQMPPQQQQQQQQQFDFNKIDQSIPYRPSQESPQEKPSISKKPRKPMFEDFSSSDEQENQQQEEQQKQQQVQQPQAPPQMSMQEAFMQKLRKMQENKGIEQEQQQQQNQPQQQKPQEQQISYKSNLESKIEEPTIVQSSYMTGRKTNNLFDDDDEDQNSKIAQKLVSQTQVSKISEVSEQEYQSHLYNPQKEIDKQDLNRQVVAPTIKKDIFGGDDDNDDTYEAFLERTQNTEIRKAGNLFNEEDDSIMFGAKQTNQQKLPGLPTLPPLNDAPKQKDISYKPPQQQQQPMQTQPKPPLMDASGKALPSFDFEPQKKSLLPKARTEQNAFDISPPPMKAAPQKKMNMFDDDDDDDDLFFKKR